MDDLIRKLSEIRSEYNCFDEDEEPYYCALSEAIRILSRRADGDTISRQDAIDAAKAHWYKPDIAGAIEQLPSACQLCTEDIAQFTGEIIEIFEDFLERKQIVIANDEKDDAITDGEDPACIGNIYGTDYGELQSDIEETLLRWRIVKED